WETKGWVAVTDGVLMTDGVESPLTNLFLRVQLVKGGAELKRLAFRIGNSDIRLSGLVRNLNRTPTVTLKAESSILDLGLLIPHDARSPIRDVLEGLAATSRVVGTFEINRGRYKGIKVNDLTGRINIAKGVVDLDRITGEAEDGQLAGRVVVHLPSRTAADVEVAFRVQRFPFEKALDLAGDDRRMITGAITAKGNVRGNGENPRGVLPTISGRVDFVIEDGRIQKGTVVPKIISLLNLPNLLQGKIDLTKDGFPFDQVAGSISIRDGLVTERNLVVDSPVMKMSAAGNYDLASNQLDVIVVTSPLGSYSQLLKSIPLFGRLLKGDRQGLDTALFRVAGPIQDPTVTYLPVRSLTTGLLGVAELAYDVLKNAIMLPADLVMPDNDATSGTPPENPAPRGTLEESP
ncbi:MAG: AsmA-like C-terminal domain-containing protein, partial [Nitrospirales bacterium]